MKWIAITTPPTEGQYVYMFGEGNRQFTALYKKGKYLAYNPFNDELEECEAVTHWMPQFSAPAK